jgi:UDP-4-amino-4,6-dideoxy-N-acetyl-beta-L-altrosamine transaminase
MRKKIYMRITGNTLKKGSICLTEFPFTDLKQTKIRPVVVLYRDTAYDDVVVMAVSSAIGRYRGKNAVRILKTDDSFKETGLRTDSAVLSNRIITLKRSRLFHRLGQLTQEYLDKIDEKLLGLFQIGVSIPTETPRSLPHAPRYLPYGRQSINEQDVAAVCKVLRSDWLTQGPTVPALEKAVADYCGVKHAVAANSGTSALHLACLALGVGPGDLVWTSPITFVATANCARYCGADVDFVDIDPQTYNLSLDYLAEKLKQAKANGRLPKVVIPVHFAGQPCDMAAIYGLSRKYGFRIIEDACHAIGGRYKGEPVGNCRYSDITIFSFHPVKNITTGEGGMAVTNDPELARTMTLLRSHGITRDSAYLENFRNWSSNGRPPTSDLRPPSFYYEQIDLGYNYRMTDIQAALGLSQLERLDEFVSRRNKLAGRYGRLLADLPLSTLEQHPDTYSAWHLYLIRLKLDQIEKTHHQVFNALREAGIGVNLHYIPVYLQPDFGRLGFRRGHCPESERYYAEAMTLPLFPAMTEEQQDNVIRALKKSISIPS